MEIVFLKKKDIESYIDLIKNVFGYGAKVEDVEKQLKKSKTIIVKEEDKVIGCATLELKNDFIKNKKYYKIDYLAVLPNYRRIGVATKIKEKIDEMCMENDIDYIELTSGNHRKSAHKFYKKNGFKIKDTSVFIKEYK